MFVQSATVAYVSNVFYTQVFRAGVGQDVNVCSTVFLDIFAKVANCTGLLLRFN